MHLQATQPAITVPRCTPTTRAMPAHVGSYQLIRPLAKPSQLSTVYLGRDRLTNLCAAVKLIPHHQAPSTLLQREGRILNNLQHRHIVGVQEWGDDAHDSYVATDFLSGATLHQVINQEGRLPWRTAAHIGVHISGAMAHAHSRGVLNRDVKASNIMIGCEQGMPHATLIDFGVARHIDENDKAVDAEYLVGTPTHIAPEVWGGEGHSVGSELYALGVTMFHALAGYAPFYGDSIMSIGSRHVYGPVPKFHEHHDIPQPMKELVYAMLAKDPDERPVSASEVRRQFLRMATQSHMVPIAVA